MSGVLTWPIRKLAIWVGAMDKPTMERKTQKEPVPYLGGVSIAATVCLITYASVIYSDNTKTTFPLVTYLLLPAVFMGAMGLVDDLRGLHGGLDFRLPGMRVRRNLLRFLDRLLAHVQSSNSALR